MYIVYFEFICYVIYCISYTFEFFCYVTYCIVSELYTGGRFLEDCFYWWIFKNFFTKHLRWLLLNFPFSKLRDSFYLKLDNHRKDLNNSKAMPAYNHSRKLVVRLKNNASVSVLQGEEKLITLGGQIFFCLLIYNFFTLLLLKWENLDWEFPFFFSKSFQVKSNHVYRKNKSIIRTIRWRTAF